MEDIAQLALFVREKSVQKAVRSGTDRVADRAQFDVLYETFRKEQQAFDDLMNAVDIAQYKIALSDGFWSGKSDAMKYLSSCMTRVQKGGMRAALLDAFSKLHVHDRKGLEISAVLTRGFLRGAIPVAAPTGTEKEVRCADRGML